MFASLFESQPARKIAGSTAKECSPLLQRSRASGSFEPAHLLHGRTGGDPGRGTHEDRFDWKIGRAPPKTGAVPWDFSRISILPPEKGNRHQTAKTETDMRGESDELELDQRLSPDAADSPPDHRLLCRASATGVSLGASGPINDGTVYGLRTPINVRGTELKDVQDSELVGTSIDHTGSMISRPSAKSSNSGFMAADKIPDDQHTSGIADHLSYYDAGGEGSYSRLQMDLYTIPNCNITTPWPIDNSGYRVNRTVKAEGSKVVGIVTKTAEDVTIGSFSTTAGLTPKKEAKVTLRS
jgi:hypothetical protein